MRRGGEKNTNNRGSGLGVGYVCLVFYVSVPLFMHGFGGRGGGRRRGGVGRDAALPRGHNPQPQACLTVPQEHPPPASGCLHSGAKEAACHAAGKGYRLW